MVQIKGASPQKLPIVLARGKSPRQSPCISNLPQPPRYLRLRYSLLSPLVSRSNIWPGYAPSDCYRLPVLMYGCEAWTISKEIENRLRATEMWFLRRMLRISYLDKVRNEEVLERAGTTGHLLKKQGRDKQCSLET